MHATNGVQLACKELLVKQVLFRNSTEWTQWNVVVYSLVLVCFDDVIFFCIPKFHGGKIPLGIYTKLSASFLSFVFFIDVFKADN